MKVHYGNYLSGMPALDTMTIELSFGVELRLSKAQYDELSEAISENNKKLIADINKADTRFEAKRLAIIDLEQDLTDIFYRKSDPDEDYLFRNDVKDISEDKISDFIKKYKNFLGLE